MKILATKYKRIELCKLTTDENNVAWSRPVKLARQRHLLRQFVTFYDMTFFFEIDADVKGKQTPC